MCKKMISLIAFVLLLSTVNNAVADLVGHWRFDGNLDDSIGEAHGTFNGGSPAYVKGTIGQGIEFDGVSQFVHLSSANPSAYTITLWVRPARTDAASVIVRTSGSGSTTHWSHQLRINPEGAFQHYLWVGSERHVVGTTLVEVATWYHVAIAAANDGPMQLYVNTEEDAASTDVAGTLWGEGDRYYVGSNSGHGLGWFQGVVDDVQIYDSILTSEEIGRIAASSGGFPLAFGPTPKDGALHLDTWVSLSWRPGDFAVSHDVYLGDNYGEVSNATVNSDVFRGNQVTTFYVAGFPGFAYPDGLVPGTTYYWRIDEVNEADPNSPWKGDVWSFSIPPKTAYNPDPADGAEFVDPNNVTLSWTPGFGAKLHTIYFGDDYDEVNNAAGGPPGGLVSYKPGPLEREKVYYWRVDEFDAVATYKGDVWNFTTPGTVGNPQPAYHATDVQLNAILSWTPADSAASHQLYFGTDKEAVRTAGIGSPEDKGSKALGAENYDPGLLDADITYYWRVDEVDDQGNTAKGPLWIFTTGAFLLVDDFEGYTDDDAAGEAIWQTWIDGFGIPDNGAQVGYLMPPYAEQTTVHGGLQSMPLLYANETGVTNSEALMTLTAPRDWTEGGVVELSLWFRGSSDNAAEPLYVAVSNSAGAPAVVAYDDPSAATVRSWTQWVIPLQALADQGIDMTKVDKIAIGLGSKSGSTAPGGSGTVYVDDIRLCQP
ncbi:LamG domain-containing protein [Planctomycetota bacterium]